jgi:uncharacterized protein
VPEIISASGFNPASLTAPDAYIVISPPPALPSTVATNVGGVVGTASWGPKNQPILLSSQQAATSAFGPIVAASLTDIHDLASDLTWAFNQAQGSGVQIGLWAVRVTDGTDLQATVILKDTIAANGGTLTALYSGIMGNQVQVYLAAGGAPSTTSVTLLGFANGYSEVYPNLPNASFWTALQSALANGVSGVRGPSQLATFTPASSSNPPAVGTFSLSGGSDGRTSVTTANLTGSNASIPYTGAYGFQGLSPAVSEFWIAGLADNTAYASMRALADGIGSGFSFAFPTGTGSTAAVTALQGYGIADYNVMAVKDWLYVFDSVNNVTRLVNPVAVAVGRILTLSPEESPLNEPVYGVIGSERNNPLTGVNTPYADPEVGLLNSAGILFMTNPSLGGAYWGFRDGVNTAAQSSQVESPVEFGRMTNYLAAVIAATSGQFAGQNQSQQTNDPLREEVTNTFNSLFQSLVTADVIDDYSVQCNAQNNQPATVAAHQMFAYFAIRYLSSVWYFVAMLTGGTTVVTSGSTISSALQAQQ